MGSSTVVQEVEDTLPGIRFKVESESRSKRLGRITLLCEIDDASMWDTVVKKLDGLKLFNTLDSEVLDALGMAVDLKQEALEAKEKELKLKNKQIAALNIELAKIRKLLTDVGMDLGLK